jgi:hypothetical protein
MKMERAYHVIVGGSRAEIDLLFGANKPAQKSDPDAA